MFLNLSQANIDAGLGQVDIKLCSAVIQLHAKLGYVRREGVTLIASILECCCCLSPQFYVDWRFLLSETLPAP